METIEPNTQNNTQFKSLTPKDPEFLSYMLGSFSETERAIPQHSLNLHTKNEVVTFEIRNIEALEYSPLWKKLWILLKPQSWLTVLIPLFMMSRVVVESNSLLTLELGVILTLLMIYSSWQADLSDHLEGWDRHHSDTNKSVLLKGWYTGQQLRRWSQRIMGICFVLGIPIILNHPWTLIPYSVLTLVLLMLMPRWWRKSTMPGVSSLCIFLLSGPLLTMGIELVFDGQMTKNSFFLGMAWGLWMSFMRQQKIYVRQWRHYQKQASYYFLGLGFDKAKSLMRLLIMVMPGVMLLPFLFVKGGSAWFFLLLVVHSAFVFWELHFNEKIQSSISSNLRLLEKLFQWHYYIISIMMMVGAIVWKLTQR